jgi:hypothetical protein
MNKEYTPQDTLNSISWQLKRIADALETIVDQTQPATTTKPNQQLTDLLKSLGK